MSSALLSKILSMLPCVRTSDAWFNIIFMNLYNKNVLKYAQILVTSGKFMYYIEGHSNFFT